MKKTVIPIIVRALEHCIRNEKNEWKKLKFDHLDYFEESLRADNTCCHLQFMKNVVCFFYKGREISV